MVKVIEVIYCDEERAGKGTEDDPIRLVKSLWTLEGTCILRIDTLDNSVIGRVEDLGGILLEC